MEQEKILRQTAEPLLEWYQKNARVLPWRSENPNTYHVWVSEIMLQQTRVEAVKPYYERFLSALPTVQTLAEADEELLLKLWEGLGYYSRVRNMQKAAQQIVAEHNGEIPAEYSILLKLKGIGPYTAGAIASIAFSKPCAAVDGNVLRVMARLTADEGNIAEPVVRKYWEKEITEALPKERPGDYNQALMELGATLCLPNGAPKCELCPLRAYCLAYRKKQTMLFPVKTKKSSRIQETLSVFFLVSENKIALHKRLPHGLLSNLWELPNCPSETQTFEFLQKLGVTRAELLPMRSQKHIFTHIEWHMECYFGKVFEKQLSNLVWVTKEEAAAEFALPSAFRKTWLEGLKQMEDF